MTFKRLISFAALLCLLSFPGLAQDEVPCGFPCVFGVGPNRPPAVEDVFDADFDLIFGPEPRLEGGKRVNVRDMAKIVQWRQDRRQWGGLIDLEIDLELAQRLFEYTDGGFPVAWKDTSGREFVAFVGVDFPVHRGRPRVFAPDSPFGYPDAIIMRWLIQKGNCIPNFPSDEATGRRLDALRSRNDQVCGQQSGVMWIDADATTEAHYLKANGVWTLVE